MVEIVPAIMPDSYDDLRAKVRQVKDHVPLVQVDIMDGTFVPSKSWPYTEGGVEGNEEFQALVRQDDGLPYWDLMDYEIDLMIQSPERHLGEWLPLGASRLVFHIESILDIDHFFRGELFAEGARKVGADTVIEVGLALNPDTELERIVDFVPKIDFIQVMGIAKIGFQGQPFDERAVTHISSLRARFPDLIISVDGAVNSNTAGVLKQAGVSRLVSGSAIFSAPDAGEAIRALVNA